MTACAASGFCSGFVFTAILLTATFAVIGALIGFVMVWAWLNDRARRSAWGLVGLVAWLSLGLCVVVGCVASAIQGSA